MKKYRYLLLSIAVLAMLSAIWFYVLLTNPAQETLDQRVQDIGSQLRCLVCQGESVADSPSQFSQQARMIIREQLQEGKSEQQIIQFFQARYGDRILWLPPKQGFSLVAWLIPGAILLGGLVLLFFVLRNWQRSAAIAIAQPTISTKETSEIDDADFAEYRAQLEQELAADDPIFARRKKEAS